MIEFGTDHQTENLVGALLVQSVTFVVVLRVTGLPVALGGHEPAFGSAD